jgi:peptidyl-prolyl cis-trans isomerase D
MLQVIRKFIASRFGAAIAIGVLILIAIAFTSGDVANNASFGGVTGGDRVALVGGERIDNATLSQAATNTLDRARQDNPRMSMKVLLADGGLESILDGLADRLALAVFGERSGIAVSDRLVDSEITKIPAFRGADGNFSETAFRQAIRQSGLSEQALRDDFKQGLMARQVTMPASFGSAMPGGMIKHYAGLIGETREGEIAVLPSMLFAPSEKPTDEELAAYYAEHEDDFIRPERRVLRYAAFDADIVKEAAKPTDEEIAARYEAFAPLYQASETRQLSQTIVPTEAAANAILAEAAKGASLEKIASAKGLAVARIKASDRTQLTREFSKAVSDAAFAAAPRAMAEPARSALGWHVMRVDKITTRPARSLAEVREELSAHIAKEKQGAVFAERLESIEDEFDGGASLAEVAKELGLETVQTPPLTADGMIYGKPGQPAPAILEPLLDTAFLMELENPQLAIIERGSRYVIFDVTGIAASAVAPFAEIKDMVEAAYKLDKGSAEARKAAENIQAEMRKGTSMRKAVSALGKRLPPPEKVKISRPQLLHLQEQGQGVPVPIVLMFRMAKGTVKVRGIQDNQAWFIVSLETIEPGEVKDDDPGLPATRRDLGRLAGDEYAQALQRAIREEIGVEKNEPAIRAVREQLGGGS